MSDQKNKRLTATILKDDSFPELKLIMSNKECNRSFTYPSAISEGTPI